MQKQAPLPGTRPQGTHDEREAALHVQEMFGEIAPRYDFLNHLLSFNLDHVWRRRTARRFTEILQRPDARVLDICCGTGDLAFALAKERKKAAAKKGAAFLPVAGSDFVQGMLERARDKALKSGDSSVFAAGDALHLPFADESCDLVTTAFGFRNLANYEQGVLEIRRVLKRGGEAGILEFSEPRSGPMAAIFQFYFRQVLPLIGGAISGNSKAYQYLPGSVAKFPSPGELAILMEKNHFGNTRVDFWNFGSVVLHRATKL